MDSALDQAWKQIGNSIGAIGAGINNFLDGGAHAASQQIQQMAPGVEQFANKANEALQQLPNQLNFDPTANGGNNFWRSSFAQGLAALQPRAENIVQGASLGYYKPDEQLQQQYQVSPFERTLEVGAGGAVPFIAGSVATGGALDAALAPEAIAALGGRELLAAGGGGLLTGAAAPADSVEQRLANTAMGGAQGLAFGALGRANPLIQSAIGSLGMAGLTALQGGGQQEVLANAVMGAGTPLFFKAIEHFGGNTSAEHMQTRLFDKFGSDAYRFMANKDLIQRVVTGQGTSEDIQQFHVLNSLGVKDAPEPHNYIDIPTSGPVWDFLETVFPNSFSNGHANPAIKDPTKTPLQYLEQLKLDPEENDTLMQINEKNPNPDTLAPTTDEAIMQKAKDLATIAAQARAGDPKFEDNLAKLTEVDGTPSKTLKPKGKEAAAPTDEAFAAQELARQQAERGYQPTPETPAPTNAELAMQQLPRLKTGEVGPVVSDAELAAQQLRQANPQLDYTNTPLSTPKVRVPKNAQTPDVLAEQAKVAAESAAMTNPEVVQHVGTIKKAIRVYNANKNGKKLTLNTLEKKVPGLQVALDAIKTSGTDVSDMAHLIALSKSLPKAEKGVKVTAPQTAVEAMVANKVRAVEPVAPVVVKPAIPGKVAVKLYDQLNKKLAVKDFEGVGTLLNEITDGAALTPKAKKIVVKDMLEHTKQAIIKDKAATPVITDPTAPGYDFVADMEAGAGKLTDNTSNAQKGEDARRTSGLDRTAAMSSGNTTDVNLPTKVLPSGGTIEPEKPGTAGSTTGPTDGNPSGINFSSQPKNGYVPELSRAVARITGDGPMTYPTDRQFTKIVQGRKETNIDIGQNEIHKWVNATLPDVAARERVGLALDDEAAAANLQTPQEHVVFEQLKGINELMGLKERELNPNFKTIENYFQRRDISPVSDAEKELMKRGGRALSETTKANVQRTIWKFIPAEGEGSFVASTESKDFPLQRSLEDPTVWEDSKGRQYLMSHATIPEAEAAGFGPFEKDAAKVAGQSITDFLNKKEHMQAVNYITSGATQGAVIAPGQPAPSGFKTLDVKGLEGWKANPKMAHAIENLASDPNVTPIEKAYGSAEKYVTNLIFFNALKHPLNMLTNALAFSGNTKTGNRILDMGLNGPIGMGKFISNLKRANDIIMQRPQEYWEMKDHGSTIGDFNKDPHKSLIQREGAPESQGRLSKVVGRIADPVGIYKGNKIAVAYFDDLFRAALTLTYKDSGMPINTAVAEADRRMVDYGNLSRNEKRAANLFGMFYPWLKGLTGNYVTMAKHPIDNSGAIVNHLLLGVAGIGSTLAWQQLTGNPNASVDQYGDISLADQAYKSVGDMQRGNMPRVVTSHFGRPLAKEAFQQVFNKDLFSQKPIYDPLTKGYNGQEPPTQSEARLVHAAGGVLAPVAPLLKINKGSQTPGEATANYLGFRTSHAMGHQAAPAGGAIGNLLNNPDAQKGNGIDYLNAKADITSKLDPTQQARLTDINQLISDSYSGGNPLDKKYAYGLLQNDPQIALAKSQIEVAFAKSKGEPPNPKWAIGITDPAAQKVIFQYQALLPEDQKEFKKIGNHQQVINVYNDLTNTYYKQVPSTADKSGYQAVVPSKEVSALLSQYDDTKKAGSPNYALLDDPRVQDYFKQKDTYDAFVNSLAGMNSGSGSGSGYSSGYSSGSSKYSLHNQLLYNLYNSVDGKEPGISLKGSDTMSNGPKVGDVKVQFGNPTSSRVSTKLPQGYSFDTPKIGKVGFNAPSSGRINMQAPRYAP